LFTPGKVTRPVKSSYRQQPIDLGKGEGGKWRKIE
jgi:hypothetical protein